MPPKNKDHVVYNAVDAIEAMTMKMPVVVFDSGAVSEIITNRETGILVKYGNIRGLAAVVEELISRADFAKELTNRAYKKVCRNFNIKKHVREIEKIYQELLVL